jgi:hypothetical protein
VMHRGRRSQTNGWALWHHSSSTFFASHRTSIDTETQFSFSVVQRWFALHGWLTGVNSAIYGWFGTLTLF